MECGAFVGVVEKEDVFFGVIVCGVFVGGKDVYGKGVFGVFGRRGSLWLGLLCIYVVYYCIYLCPYVLPNAFKRNKIVL